MGYTPEMSWGISILRLGNGVGKQGYGNRTPFDDRNAIRKFSVDPLCLQNQSFFVEWDSTVSPRQRIKEKSRCRNSVLIPHRRYRQRLRTPFLRTPFPRLLIQKSLFRPVQASFRKERLGKGWDQDRPDGPHLRTHPTLQSKAHGKSGREHFAPEMGCLGVVNNRRKPKGDGGKGTGKNVTTIYDKRHDKRHDNLRHLATFYDNFRLFVPLT